MGEHGEEGELALMDFVKVKGRVCNVSQETLRKSVYLHTHLYTYIHTSIHEYIDKCIY